MGQEGIIMDKDIKNMDKEKPVIKKGAKPISQFKSEEYSSEKTVVESDQKEVSELEALKQSIIKYVDSKLEELTKGTILPTTEETEEILYVKLLRSDIKAPVKVRESDAGFDIFAIEDFEILPNERVILPTGISLCIPYGYYGQIHDRSSMASKGLEVSGGVIDSEYRGEIGIVLTNTKRFTREFEKIPYKDTFSIEETKIPDGPFKINKGNKIAQIVIHKIALPKIEIVKDLPKSDRGSKGWGSSGK